MTGHRWTSTEDDRGSDGLTESHTDSHNLTSLDQRHADCGSDGDSQNLTQTHGVSHYHTVSYGANESRKTKH